MTNTKADLRLEIKGQTDPGPQGNIRITPPISENYWEYRVVLSEKQAVLGFPNFFLCGIGFAIEEDWNTNLPSTCLAEEIYEHIKDNKGDDSIPDELVIEAIRMIQAQVEIDYGWKVTLL